MDWLIKWRLGFNNAGGVPLYVRRYENTCSAFPTADQFFASLKLADSDDLLIQHERKQCPLCHKRRMYYCYSCYVYLG
jgi:hypothetical protein